MSAETVTQLNEFGQTRLPGLLAVEILEAEPHVVVGRLRVTAPLIAGTDFLFAPAVVGLADVLCAYGAGQNRPGPDTSFTTLELKANFLGTARAGEVVVGRAVPVHLGGTTQVWDATISNQTSGKTIALFRCTQLILQRRG